MLFPLHGQARLPVVLAGLVVQHQLGTDDVGSQVVAGVFHIGAYAKLFLCLGIVQPVLTLNVVRLLFLGVEGRSQEADLCLLREVTGKSYCTEQCAEISRS